MLFEKDGHIFYDGTRCTRCGTCLAVCPVDALHQTQGHDIFEIAVDPEVCIVCQKCVRVCPAAKLPEKPLKESDFNTMRRAVLACSADETVRLESTSGGVARSLARAVLETGWADAVYCAVKQTASPWAEGGLITSPEEIGRIANSVYCAFPFNRNLSKKVNGRPLSRLLYIGTNCQIQGGERYFKGSGVELVKVGIICKQQKTRAYTRWARRKLRQSPQENTPICFRGPGWPGTLCSGNSQYRNYFRPFAMELWRVPGCRSCPNAWGEGSDILLADPWNIVRPEAGNPGLTMTVLRSEAALELWKIAAPYLREERELTAEDVKKSMDWACYRHKQAQIPYFLGRESSPWRRATYGLLETQRSLYGWLFDKFPVPELVEKVLNRTFKK